MANPPGLLQSMTYLDSVHPTLKKKGIAHINEAHKKGVNIAITSGYRSLTSQQNLYNQGRTTPGEIVTNAQPGDSWHNHGLAYDVAILNSNNQPTWPSKSDPRWEIIGNTGINQGLNWGKSFDDYPHFDWHPDVTLTEAKMGVIPKSFAIGQVLGGLFISAFMAGIWYNLNYPNTRINKQINNVITKLTGRSA